jgi:hypothetical protein
VNSPREIFERQYKAAAAEGAAYELYIPLLADEVPELQQSAYGQKLEGVEELIVAHFSSALREDERTISDSVAGFGIQSFTAIFMRRGTS